MRKRVFKLVLTTILMVGLIAALAFSASADTVRYWPVPGHTSLSRGYIDGHPAIDIHDSAINGAPVIASVGGTVYQYYSCPNQHYGSNHDCNGFGTGIVIKGDDGWYYQYAHMQANSLTVTYGQYVPAGTVIGKVGTTGNSSGPHLHFSIASTSSWWVPDINPQALSFNYGTPGASYANLGDNFYAYIKFPTTGHGICNVNDNIQLDTYGGQNSLWNFVRQSDGSYKIISAANGNVMDVFNNNTANETNLWTYPSNDTIAQRFYIQTSGDKYNIIAANCGKAVDVKDGANSTVGTNVHIFSQNGAADQLFEINITNWVQLNGTWYYHVNGAFHTGWLNLGGTWYYMNSDGSMATGWLQLGNTWYYLNEGGNMATGWLNLGGTWYYMNGDGSMATGWLNLGGTWYYMNADGSMATGWLLLGNTWYYLDTSGAMQTGTVTINGTQHSFSSSGTWLGEVAAQTGWVQQNGYWYYYDANGNLTYGWLQLGGYWYAFNEHGQMITGWAYDSNYEYYFESNGIMQTGWQQIDGYWYFFESNGAMQVGWKQIDGYWYYFQDTGAMYLGWLNLDGTWYAFNGSGQMIIGWGKDGDNYYYFNSSGAMVTGWQYINGYWYYFDNNGVLRN